MQQIRRPSVGVFRPRQKGRFTSPLPPSAGPLRRHFGSKPRGAALKVRTPTTKPAQACKNHAPQGGSPQGSLWDPLRFLVLGFKVLELPPGTCETGLHTSGAGVRTCEAAPPRVPKAPHGSAKRCPPPKAARSAAPADRPNSAERRRRDRRAGKARAKHEPAETRIFPARLRQVRVDGNNPQG